MIKKIFGTIIFFLFVSSANAVEPTVSNDWLKKNLNNPNVFILDIRNKFKYIDYIGILRKTQLLGYVLSK